MHVSCPVAYAAVFSKAVVLLLLIYWLMYFTLFVGALCLYSICYELLLVHSCFAIILKKEEKAGSFAVVVLRMYCHCGCSLALPQGTMGWFAL